MAVPLLHCIFPHRGLRDGMKRWTNGLPGATTRLGAKTAHRGLAASQLGCARIPMLVRSKIALLRDLIHCCSSHVRRSRRSVLQRTAGPYILAQLGLKQMRWDV